MTNPASVADTRTDATASEPPSQQELKAEADRLYATYVKPLEPEHWGQYVAVARDGRTLLGNSSDEVLRRAAEELGLGNFLFKVGEVVVGALRPRYKEVPANGHLVAAPAGDLPSQEELAVEGQRLYETYVKPLEPEHRGKYVAVARDGRMVLGTDRRELLQRATDALGRGNFLFKVGEEAAGRIR